MSDITLPQNWVHCLLTTICNPKQYKTIATKELKNNGYTIYGANGVIGKYSDFTHEKPTLMITCRGASCGNLHVSEPFSYINGNAMALDNVNPNFINLKFFYFALLSRGFSDVITGSAQPQITRKSLNELRFALSPLAEQKEIVRLLDIYLATVTQIQARLDAIPKILEKFRQSVLNDAMSGRLTEKWVKERDFLNSAEDELLKIISDRNEKVAKKNRKPAEHLKNEVYETPEHWVWTSLDSLSLKIVDGTHHTPTYIEQGVPFISVKDIRNGKISFENTRFISNQEHLELSKRCNVEKGDLLITKSGTIGRTAIVDTNRDFSLFVSVALIKPASSLVNMKFIELALKKWINEIDISNRIVGGLIKNLHLRDMRVLAIPLPPYEEQNQVIKCVTELFTYAEQIEKSVAAAKARVDNLTQSILHQAFTGQLTAEWREQNPELISGDNSAEALLARIQAEG